jgi:DNA primase
MPSPFTELQVGARMVRVTNPDKVLFPARGETKLDLVSYYLSVGEGIVRALYERPTQLRRFPDGVTGEAIYQKRVPQKRPDWIEVARVTFPSGRHADELCVTELAHVAWAANLAVSTSIRGRRAAPTSTGRTSCASTSILSRAPPSLTASGWPEPCARC